MDQDETWHGSIGVGPCHIKLDGDQLPHGKGHSSPPQFSAHFALARSPISETAEHLLTDVSGQTDRPTYRHTHRSSSGTRTDGEVGLINSVHE